MVRSAPLMPDRGDDPREPRLERPEEGRGEHRLQILESGAPQIGVGGLQGARRDLHRLALQGESRGD